MKHKTFKIKTLKSSKQFDIELWNNDSFLVVIKKLKDKDYKLLRNESLFYNQKFEYFHCFDLIEIDKDRIITKYIPRMELYETMKSLSNGEPPDVIKQKLPLAIAEYQKKIKYKDNKIETFMKLTSKVIFLLKEKQIYVKNSIKVLCVIVKEVLCNRKYPSNQDLCFSNMMVYKNKIYLYDFENLSSRRLGYDICYFLNHIPRNLEDWNWEKEMIKVYREQFPDIKDQYFMNDLRESYILSAIVFMYINHKSFKGDERRSKAVTVLKHNLEKALLATEWVEVFGKMPYRQ